MSLRCLSLFFRHRMKSKPVLYRSYSVSNAKFNMGFESYGCSISGYGSPLNTVALAPFDVKFNHNSAELLLKTHASPINPSDINIIEGKYPILPKSLPAVIGNEGIFEVQRKGKLCSSSAPEVGQFVIPSVPLLGSWQQYLTCNESDVIPLNVHIDEFEKYDQHLISQLSMLTVNPCTAYRMINDFVALEGDDFIIQNAANSAVGECVIQIARNYSLRTVNIIRGSVNGTESRSAAEFDSIKAHLLSMGADTVVGDHDLSQMSKEERDKLSNGSAPRLALNAVGGSVVNDMMKCMSSDDKSVLVTYGGMSKKPLTISTAALIFKDIQLTGFWMSKWKKKSEIDRNMREEYNDMIQTLTEMMKDHDLEMSYKLVKFGKNGEGMMSGLKYALNAVEDINKEDEECLMHIEENETPKEVRGKIIYVFNEDFS